jgi:hypothetical protein
VQTSGALIGANVFITSPVPVTLSGGQVVATAGSIAVSSPNTTIGAGERVTTTASKGTIAFDGAMTQQSGSRISLNGGTLSAASINQTGGTIASVGSSLQVTSAGSIGIGGTMSSAGTLALQAAQGITETPSGVVQAALLTGSAGGAVALNGANRVAVLGDFSAPNTAFGLTDGSDLTVGGVINAGSVALATPNSTLTLGAGSGFSGLAGGHADTRSNQPFPSAGTAGAYLQGANITNNNPSLSLSGASPVALTFALTGPGRVTLGTLRQPAAKLFLDLANGTADGAINVAGLQVRYGPATGAVINLTGTVAGVTGAGAAAISFISPSQRPNYQINGCPISGSCTSTAIVTSINGVQNLRNLTTIPIINGLQDLQMGGMLQDFDTDTLLPDVADRDY